MKCPLRYKIEKHAATFVEFEFPDCLKEECAWWDTTGGVCAINGIRHSLRTLCVETNKVAKELTLIRPAGK